MSTRRRRVGGDVCAIFVHAGAGHHAFQNERITLEGCEDATRDAMAYLNNGGSAVKAVEMAIQSFEDNANTNAGYGSNLTRDGVVECDATVMDHYGRGGAVGALRQVRNPINLARLVLENSTKPMVHHQIPPNLLVGPGALEFACQHGVAIVEDKGLVSIAARENWLDLKAKLRKSDRSEVSVSSSSGQGARILSVFEEEEEEVAGEEKVDEVKEENGEREGEDEEVGCSTGIVENGEGKTDEPATPKPADEDKITDTVGAIAIDCLGNMAAGSSSGGIPMKHQGRVGPAALVGIGTAVIPIDPRDPQRTCAATVISGTGEHMATTLAASTCARRIQSSTSPGSTGAIRAFIEEDFLAHPALRHSHTGGQVGVLGAKKTVDGVWLYFAHNTDDFALAYMATDDTQPESIMSRRNKDRGQKISSGLRRLRHLPNSPWCTSVNNTWLANPDDALNPPTSSLILI